jgi:biopolymer transport protein ExbB
MTVWQHFQDGGWAMWLILVWLVAAAVVFLQRTIYLFAAHQEVSVFTAAITKLVEVGDWDRAIRLCGAAKTPLGRITQHGLSKASLGARAFQAGMDEQALRELPALRKNTDYMALFANLAMLSGLFGTIIGLIRSFGAVGGESVDPSEKARILAEGISEAMNCTAFGILTAILALLGFALLSRWSQTIEEDIDSETVKLLNAVVRRSGGF